MSEPQEPQPPPSEPGPGDAPLDQGPIGEGPAGQVPPGQPPSGDYPGSGPAGGYAAGGTVPSYPPVGNLPLVSNGKRFGAYLLDVLLALVTCGVGWFVWSLIIWGRGQSPAKQLLKLRCIDARTGRLASYGQMALRELVGKYLLSSVTFSISTIIGGVMILGDEERRQGIWDKIGNTIVVDDPYDSLAAEETSLT